MVELSLLRRRRQNALGFQVQSQVIQDITEGHDPAQEDRAGQGKDGLFEDDGC